MFKFYSFLLVIFTVTKYMSNNNLVNTVLDRLIKAKQLFDKREYFNCLLVIDNLRNIYRINNITDSFLNKQLDELEKLTKELR